MGDANSVRKHFKTDVSDIKVPTSASSTSLDRNDVESGFTTPKKLLGVPAETNNIIWNKLVCMSKDYLTEAKLSSAGVEKWDKREADP